MILPCHEDLHFLVCNRYAFFTRYRAQEEFSQEKEKHEKELGKASVMLKRAEVKILSLTSSLEEKNADNQRLAALLDDITNKFG